VTPKTAHALEIAVIAILFGLHIIRLSRLQRISFRYTVGWLALSAITLFAGILVPVISPVANYLKIAPFVLLASGAITVLLVICIQLTVSISFLQRGQQKMNEEVAFARLEIEKLRDRKE